MKGGSSSKLRVKKLSLTLISLICLTFAIWVWEKTPLLTSFLPPLSDEFDIRFSLLSPVTPVQTHSLTHSVGKHPEPSIVEVPTEPSIVEVPTEPSIEELPSESTTEDSSSATVKSEDSKRGGDVPLRGDADEISSNETKDEDNLKTVNSECNYAKGKWVVDSRRPLYSGLGCKQWLSEMWSCRLNQRADSFYENYRWEPKDCEMPEFEGSRFLRKMQHKTVAFVGDSLGRQQFQSLMCMVTGGKEYLYVEDIGRQYGLVKAPGAKRPDGWAYRFTRTNTTILYYWSASLCEIEPLNRTDPTTSYAMHLDRPATFLKQYIHRFDVVVLNTGHHWNRGKVNGNRWIMYVNGKPNGDKKIAIIWNAKNLTAHSVVKWIDSQIANNSRLKVFFRTISPRHFVNGDWNTGGSCDNTTPLSGGSEVTKDGSDDPVVENAVKGTRVKLLDITAMSQLRDEGHVSKYSIRAQPGMYDCLHWCLPGIPDTWNELLAAQV